MFFELIKQMTSREGVSEQFKAQDQMLWMQRMNNIRDRAMEVVNNELVFIETKNAWRYKISTHFLVYLIFP